MFGHQPGTRLDRVEAEEGQVLAAQAAPRVPEHGIEGGARVADDPSSSNTWSALGGSSASSRRPGRGAPRAASRTPSPPGARVLTPARSREGPALPSGRSVTVPSRSMSLWRRAKVASTKSTSTSVDLNAWPCPLPPRWNRCTASAASRRDRAADMALMVPAPAGRDIRGHPIRGGGKTAFRGLPGERMEGGGGACGPRQGPAGHARRWRPTSGRGATGFPLGAGDVVRGVAGEEAVPGDGALASGDEDDRRPPVAGDDVPLHGQLARAAVVGIPAPAAWS